MKNIELAITKIINKKGMKINDLIKRIGISQNAYYKMLKSNSVKAQTLEKIAKEFKVPISYFFDDDTNEVHEPPAEYKNVSVDEEIKNISDSLKKIVNKIIAENKATI
jgi:transcriptional regulator with XRE-family HTH domain